MSFLSFHTCRMFVRMIVKSLFIATLGLESPCFIRLRRSPMCLDGNRQLWRNGCVLAFDLYCQHLERKRNEKKVVDKDIG